MSKVPCLKLKRTLGGSIKYYSYTSDETYHSLYRTECLNVGYITLKCRWSTFITYLQSFTNQTFSGKLFKEQLFCKTIKIKKMNCWPYISDIEFCYILKTVRKMFINNRERKVRK